jgi:hypothetical protein
MLSHLLPLLFLLVCPLGMAAIMLGPGRCAGSGVVPAMAPGTARGPCTPTRPPVRPRPRPGPGTATVTGLAGSTSGGHR